MRDVIDTPRMKIKVVDLGGRPATARGLSAVEAAGAAERFEAPPADPNAKGRAGPELRAKLARRLRDVAADANVEMKKEASRMPADANRMPADASDAGPTPGTVRRLLRDLGIVPLASPPTAGSDPSLTRLGTNRDDADGRLAAAETDIPVGAAGIRPNSTLGQFYSVLGREYGRYDPGLAAAGEILRAAFPDGAHSLTLSEMTSLAAESARLNEEAGGIIAFAGLIAPAVISQRVESVDSTEPGITFSSEGSPPGLSADTAKLVIAAASALYEAGLFPYDPEGKRIDTTYADLARETSGPFPLGEPADVVSGASTPKQAIASARKVAEGEVLRAAVAREARRAEVERAKNLMEVGLLLDALKGVSGPGRVADVASALSLGDPGAKGSPDAALAAMTPDERRLVSAEARRRREAAEAARNSTCPHLAAVQQLQSRPTRAALEKVRGFYSAPGDNSHSDKVHDCRLCGRTVICPHVDAAISAALSRSSPSRALQKFAVKADEGTFCKVCGELLGGLGDEGRLDHDGSGRPQDGGIDRAAPDRRRLIAAAAAMARTALELPPLNDPMMIARHVVKVALPLVRNAVARAERARPGLARAGIPSNRTDSASLGDLESNEPTPLEDLYAQIYSHAYGFNLVLASGGNVRFAQIGKGRKGKDKPGAPSAKDAAARAVAWLSKATRRAVARLSDSGASVGRAFLASRLAEAAAELLRAAGGGVALAPGDPALALSLAIADSALFRAAARFTGILGLGSASSRAVRRGATPAEISAAVWDDLLLGSKAAPPGGPVGLSEASPTELARAVLGIPDKPGRRRPAPIFPPGSGGALFALGGRGVNLFSALPRPPAKTLPPAFRPGKFTGGREKGRVGKKKGSKKPTKKGSKKGSKKGKRRAADAKALAAAFRPGPDPAPSPVYALAYDLLAEKVAIASAEDDAAMAGRAQALADALAESRRRAAERARPSTLNGRRRDRLFARLISGTELELVRRTTPLGFVWDDRGRLHKWDGETCTVCGANRAAASRGEAFDEADVLTALDNLAAARAFFGYFSSTCPLGGLHEFADTGPASDGDSVCSKCGAARSMFDTPSAWSSPEAAAYQAEHAEKYESVVSGRTNAMADSVDAAESAGVTLFRSAPADLPPPPDLGKLRAAAELAGRPAGWLYALGGVENLTLEEIGKLPDATLLGAGDGPHVADAAVADFARRIARVRFAGGRTKLDPETQSALNAAGVEPAEYAGLETTVPEPKALADYLRNRRAVAAAAAAKGADPVAAERDLALNTIADAAAELAAAGPVARTVGGIALGAVLDNIAMRAFPLAGSKKKRRADLPGAREIPTIPASAAPANPLDPSDDPSGKFAAGGDGVFVAPEIIGEADLEDGSLDRADVEDDESGVDAGHMGVFGTPGGERAEPFGFSGYSENYADYEANLSGDLSGGEG